MKEQGNMLLALFLNQYFCKNLLIVFLVLLSHTLLRIYMRLIGLFYLILQSQSKHLTCS